MMAILKMLAKKKNLNSFLQVMNVGEIIKVSNRFEYPYYINNIVIDLYIFWRVFPSIHFLLIYVYNYIYIIIDIYIYMKQ